MKTTVFSTVIAVFVLLLSFQNCQKPPYPDEINNQKLNFSETANKIDLNHEAVESLNVIISDYKLVSKAGNTYQIKYNKILKIELKGGIILETSDLDNTEIKYCLTESLKDELVALLKSSQVCRTQPSLPEGTVCTQALKTPYAQVMTDKEQFDLGSASDGCGSNTVDLCEQQADLLKAYIENIKKQYQQLVCP